MQAKGPTRGQCNSSDSTATTDAKPHAKGPRFPLGMVCATPGALDFLVAHRITGAILLARHQMGDWGDLCAEDRAANDRALVEGSRIFSAYQIGSGKLWVITEHDRTITTILLPEEY